VVEAHDGQHALQEFLSQLADIDLVLTDVRMPLLKGNELAHRLRELRPSIPVVFMSGYVSETIVTSLNGDEPVTILAKPFSQADLLSAVQEALASAV
jgi:CheY-like chemotaxis protein